MVVSSILIGIERQRRILEPWMDARLALDAWKKRLNVYEVKSCCQWSKARANVSQIYVTRIRIEILECQILFYSHYGPFIGEIV